MKQPISCRHAIPTDLDFIYQSLFDMAIEEGIGERFHLDKTSLNACLFNASPLAEVLIAQINTLPIGLAMFSVTHRNFTLFKKPGMYVHDIYVLPPHRQQGVALQLGQTLRTYAKERDYGRIDWVVLNQNKLGNTFFENMQDAVTVDYIKTMRIYLNEEI